MRGRQTSSSPSAPSLEFPEPEPQKMIPRHNTSEPTTPVTKRSGKCAEMSANQDFKYSDLTEYKI